MANNIHSTYAILCLALIGTSCSQEEAERGGNRQPGDRIEFKAALPEVSSRASEVTRESLREFQVSAFTVGDSSETPYFSDRTFSLNANTGMYVSYDPECVWPNNADLLRFVAFHPSTASILAAGGKGSLDGDRLTGFSVPRDIASHFDFVTAIATGRLLDDEETGISLRFQHQLSRICLKAWGDSKSYDLEIAGVRIGGIGAEGTFRLNALADASESALGGQWETVGNGNVEYIFRAGEKTVKLDGEAGSTATAADAVTILGAISIGGESFDSSAMVVPSANTGWNYKENGSNGDNHEEGMYISVLLRVIDDTPYDSNGSLVYPYSADALGDEYVYLAVDKEDGSVKTRIYRQGDDYFTDAEHTARYEEDANAEIKAFGWAALPVQDELKAGYVYTYTLNYANGVGLRDPHDSNPGDPIISDKVLVDVEVTDWKEGSKSDVTVPRR